MKSPTHILQFLRNLLLPICWRTEIKSIASQVLVCVRNQSFYGYALVLTSKFIANVAAHAYNSHSTSEHQSDKWQPIDALL